MSDFINCNYEENLVFQLERISRELATEIPDLSEDNILLLNQNTEFLNKELRNFRRLQNDLSKSKKITPTTKRKFKEQFVPRSIAKEFTQVQIETTQDLIRYVLVNPETFRGSNISSEDKILEALQQINPNEFMTFGSEFPSIELRLRSGPISSSEVAGLIKENAFDPRLFTSGLEQNRRGIFNLLERFLSALGIGIGIMGSFCALVENIYALSKGQRDITANPTEFLQNFQNVLGLVNPNAEAVVGQVQELIQLLQEAQSNAMGVANNLQGAIGLLASAFGITMNFVDILDKITGKTDQTGSIEVGWDLETIRDAISNNDTRFLAIVPETGKQLGDINQDGTVTGDDAIALQTYIDGIPFTAVSDYVDDIFIPFLNQNADTYSEFADFPTAGNPNSNIGDLIVSFSSVAKRFGSGAGSGDFGLVNTVQAISLTAGIISSIQSLVGGSKPVNIQGIFQQLDQVIELTDVARKGLFSDFNEFSNDYKEETEKTLKEAEDNAVNNPEKAAEISKKNQEALEENYTKALESTAEASKNLGPRVNEVIGRIKNGIQQLAAVGVLDQTADQLLSVIEQSANQLAYRIKMFSPESIDNGFHFNMNSSYTKMAGQIAMAENMASNETTQTMKDSVKGMMAQSSEKFRQKNKEEVEFVALRFCKLAGEIERMYKEVTVPIEAMVRSFQGIDRNLSGVGNNVTLRAVNAGAIRYDTQTRLSAMQAAGNVDATFTRDFRTGRRLALAPGTLPSISITGPLPPLPKEYSDLPRYTDVTNGAWNGLFYYNLGGDTKRFLRNANLPENMGWDGIFYYPGIGRNSAGVDMLKRFIILAREWQKLGKITPLQINSAYRPFDEGSQHGLGKALDIKMAQTEQRQFADMARRYGFGGIGFYESFIHIDTGTERSWVG
jgi:hypothetical protein